MPPNYVSLSKDIMEKAATPDSMYRQAVAVVEKCKCKQGFWASASYYGGQLWLRDLYYSLPGLKILGYLKEAKNQLLLTLKKVRKNGVPDYVVPFTQRWAALFRPRAWVGLFLDSPYRPWVADTPLLLLILVRQVGLEIPNQLSHKLVWVEQRIRALRDPKTGLIEGCDYRDSLLFHLPLLTNQVDLYVVLRLMGKTGEAEEVREAIEKFYFSKKLGYYTDIPNGRRFDVVGHVKLIQSGLLEGKSAERMIKHLLAASAPYGLRNFYPPYTPVELRESWAKCLEKFKVSWRLRVVFKGGVERNARGEYQNSTVWPFVHNLAVETLAELGFEKEAKKLFMRVPGFHECYDPQTGRPLGSPDQLWSAATWISAYQKLFSP
jgi:GH15 family glucan-1,4-alpha-glucosidase